MRTSSTSTIRLCGHWLSVTRAAWVALIALNLVVLIASIPSGYQESLSLAQYPILSEAGLSPNLVAAYLVAIQVIFALGCLVPAVMIFWRQSGNWMALLVSLVGEMFVPNISGLDLGRFLHERGRLPLEQALSVVQDIADALDYAHRQGLVHRDVKPSNVMLRPDLPTVTRQIPCQAVLTDFGLAKALGASTRLTHTGDIVGTLSYIAPEQVQAADDVDGRADIYALGIMVYQMLTGNLPFRQESPGALLIAHLTQPPPDPREYVPDLPDQVACALHRALAKGPEQRYATAGEFARALRMGE